MHEYKLEEFAGRVDAKINDFREVLETLVRPSWENGPWVAGGSVRRLISGSDPLGSDIDVFFAYEQQKDDFLARVTKDFKVLSSFSNELNTTLTLEMPIATSVDAFGDSKLEKTIVVKLQAIHVDYYEGPAAIIDSFDYTICQLVTDGKQMLVGPYTLFDIGRKRLALHRLTYAVATMRRMVKYTQQGFYACPGMMTNLLNQVVDNPALINSDYVYLD